MDRSSIETGCRLNLCARCWILFLDPKNEKVIQWVEADVKAFAIARAVKIVDDTIEESFAKCVNTEKFCTCCFGAMSGDSLTKLTELVYESIANEKLAKRRIYLNVLAPPTVDVARLTTRTIITRNVEKTFAFPTIKELLSRLLSERLSKSHGLTVVEDESAAEVQVTLLGDFERQFDFCKAMYADFRIKSKKRKMGETPVEEMFEVSRNDSDSVLIHYKSLNHTGIANLEKSFTTFMNDYNKEISWSVSTTPRPIYLLGRYRKLARDVPQAPWTLGEERKGRNSVEEIVSAAVKEVLLANACRMHPCGREDIDVRCLGNGRPFVMEVVGAYAEPDDRNSCLQRAVELVASNSGLNEGGDVELLSLSMANRGVWETMQTVAEEKRKAYVCICWSADPLTPEKLQYLSDISTGGAGTVVLPGEQSNNNDESNTPGTSGGTASTCAGAPGSAVVSDSATTAAATSNTTTTADATIGTGSHGKVGGRGSDDHGCGTKTGVMFPGGGCTTVDEDGRLCLKIIQKTPLRVLHRRSLLDRPRYIYNMRAVMLNEHYFLLSMVTSAGAYVKEFVHGDLGRTRPSVSSIFGCEADILQLDVAWLYDDFEGGGEPPANVPWSDAYEKLIADTNDGAAGEDNVSSGKEEEGGGEAVLRIPIVPDTVGEWASWNWTQLKSMTIAKIGTKTNKPDSQAHAIIADT